MAELAKKVETNVKDRISAVTILTDGAAKTIRSAIDHLLKLEPVQAVAAVVADGGDGAADFIKKQAEITRKWLK